jgi:CDP-diacylglycerol--glycerol-3-phosphate 3-phosphatidyltransferase
MPTLLPHSVPRTISQPIAGTVARAGIKPNQVTVLGLVLNVVAGILVALGFLLAGGIVMLLGGALDLVDGALARLIRRATPFGSVFDAVCDRYGEGIILFGLLIWELNRGARIEPALIFAAAVGSFLVSYTRARSEIIRATVKEGLFTRAERVVLLALGLILHDVPYVLVAVLWILAVLTNLTAVQRLYLVWVRSKDLPPLPVD